MKGLVARAVTAAMTIAFLFSAGVWGCAHRIALDPKDASATNSAGTVSVRLHWLQRDERTVRALAAIKNGYAFPVIFGASEIRFVVDGARLTLVDPAEPTEVRAGEEREIELSFEAQPGKNTHGLSSFVLAPKNAIDGAAMPAARMSFELTEK